MKKQSRLNKKDGFTLIEILISTALLSFVFVAAVSFVSTTLRFTQLNKHTIMATHYAEALQEWIDIEQESDWEQFTTRSSSVGTIYCFNERLQHSIFVSPNWPNGECKNRKQDFQGIDGVDPAIFNREVTLTSSGTPVTRVQSVVRVFWNELGREREVTFVRIYSLYQ